MLGSPFRPFERRASMPWTNKIAEAIEALTVEASAGGMVFLTEDALKVHLCGLVRSALREEANTITVKTENPSFDDDRCSPIFVDMMVFDRALLRKCWDSYLGEEGHCYDGPFVAIKLKYCRDRGDVRVVLEDISKLEGFLGKPHDRCFLLALARTQAVFAEAAQLIDQAHDIRLCGHHAVTVHLCGVSGPERKKTWEFS
jgi:hypothetical protein